MLQLKYKCTCECNCNLMSMQKQGLGSELDALSGTVRWLRETLEGSRAPQAKAAQFDCMVGGVRG